LINTKRCEECGGPMPWRGPKVSGKARFCSHTCFRAKAWEPDRIVSRLLTKVAMPASYEACWPWVGSINPYGYGQARVGSRAAGTSRMVGAHRAMYEVAVGPIPDGLQLDHLCRVRHCVNPLHLEPVTKYVNGIRGESFSAINARKTHCPRGHPYDSRNVSNGGRMCSCCKTAEARAAAAVASA